MNQNKEIPIAVVDFRADDYSPDGKSVIVSLTTKYSAQRRTYSLPLPCLYAFIADLQKLQSMDASQATPSAAPTATPPPLSEAEKVPTAAKDLNRINLTLPKRWMMRSGLPEHPLVYLVFDPRTEGQSGYALSASSAKELAAGLLKCADMLEQHELGQSKSN
jgi:hypothetical protein